MNICSWRWTLQIPSRAKIGNQATTSVQISHTCEIIIRLSVTLRYGAAGYLLPSRPQFSRGSLAVRTKLFRFVTCCDFIPDHERLIEARRKPASRMLFSLVLILGFIAFCYCIVVVFYVSPSLRACVHKGFPIPMQGLGNQSKRQPKADAFLSGRRSRLKIVLCAL